MGCLNHCGGSGAGGGGGGGAGGGGGGDLMASAQDSESRGPGSRSGWFKVLCSEAKHFSLTMPLSIPEYKCVPLNC